MSYNNPKSLKYLSIDVVCDHIEELYCNRKNYRLHSPVDRVEFIDTNIYLPMEVSEILLTNLSSKNILNDEKLMLFSDKNVYLRNVILPKTKNLTKKGLSTLKNHKIKKLDVHSLKCIKLNELVGLLGEWTIQNLETLCVPNSFVNNNSSDLINCVTVALSKLKNLRSLDISCTVFNTNNLMAIVDAFPHLESLDISNTHVDTLIPLAKIRNQLKKLSVHNLKDNTMHSFMHHHEGILAFSPLKCMTSLTHLDLSSEKCSHPLKSFSCNTPWLQFLTDPDWLPNLILLDISGSDNVGPKIMQDFLTTHKKLRYLGLMLMDLDCGLAMFTIPTHPLYNCDLEVTGLVTEEQLLAGLKRYTKRSTYIQQCLDRLFKWTEKYKSPIADIIQLILNVMDCFSENIPVLLEAMACIYNLTKNDLASKIHLGVVANVAEATLDVLNRFPNEKLLQKNSVLTLSNDCILQDVKMNKLRCVRLVLDSLNETNDEVEKRTKAYIISILTSKMSSSEKLQIGLNPAYIQKFNHIVYEKLFGQTGDITVIATLDILLNLTDKSPATCQMLVNQRGLELYICLLNKLFSISAVETKVLGLLNNIAVVPQLKIEILKCNIVPTLWRLLESVQINNPDESILCNRIVNMINIIR